MHNIAWTKHKHDQIMTPTTCHSMIDTPPNHDDMILLCTLATVTSSFTVCGITCRIYNFLHGADGIIGCYQWYSQIAIICGGHTPIRHYPNLTVSHKTSHSVQATPLDPEAGNYVRNLISGQAMHQGIILWCRPSPRGIPDIVESTLVSDQTTSEIKDERWESGLCKLHTGAVAALHVITFL